MIIELYLFLYYLCVASLTLISIGIIILMHELGHMIAYRVVNKTKNKNLICCWKFGDMVLDVTDLSVVDYRYVLYMGILLGYLAMCFVLVGWSMLSEAVGVANINALMITAAVYYHLYYIVGCRHDIKMLWFTWRAR